MAIFKSGTLIICFLLSLVLFISCQEKKPGDVSGNTGDTLSNNNTNQSTSQNDWCNAFNTILSEMKNGFAGMRAETAKDKFGEYWKSKILLEGAREGMIRENPSNFASAFPFFSTTNYNSADSAYLELQEKIKACAPKDWHPSENSGENEGVKFKTYKMEDSTSQATNGFDGNRLMLYLNYGSINENEYGVGVMFMSAKKK